MYKVTLLAAGDVSLKNLIDYVISSDIVINEISRIEETSTFEDTVRDPNANIYEHTFNLEVCKYCSNNPSNGGSGICNCILRSPKIT